MDKREVAIYKERLVRTESESVKFQRVLHVENFEKRQILFTVNPQKALVSSVML